MFVFLASLLVVLDALRYPKAGYRKKKNAFGVKQGVRSQLVDDASVNPEDGSPASSVSSSAAPSLESWHAKFPFKKGGDDKKNCRPVQGQLDTYKTRPCSDINKTHLH